MANILIGYNNRALDATMTSNGSWDGTLVLNNIKSERLALVARTASASRNNTTFVAKFAANYALRAIALLNHNVSTAGRWRARLSTATLDLNYTGTNPRNPGNVTFSGGANGTYVDYLGTVTSGSCPRFDYSPVNLASGAATQTVSSVQAGRYVLSCSGSGSVTATGSTVDNSGTTGTQSIVTFVDLTATGDVTLTVTGTVTAIHFRESLGLLIEGAATNELRRSEDFSHADWVATGAGTGSSPVVTANAATSPDGTANADSIVFDAGAGATLGDESTLAQTRASGTATIGQPVTLSMYVRGTPGAVLVWRGAGMGAYGTITLSSTWTRVTRTETATVDTAYLEVGIRQGTAAGTINSTVTAELWGAQSEQASTASSYIETTTAAVTRTADSVSLTSTAFSSWYSATEGTLYVEATAAATGATRGLASLNDGSGSNVTQLFLTSTDAPRLEVYNGATQANITASAVTPATANKIVGAYKANDFALCANGGTVGTDTSGAVPTVTQLSIGAINGATNALNGHIRRITYWPTRLTDAQLQAITTTGPEAIGYHSGWQDALALTFHGDTPTNWGAQYPLIAATSEAVTARYLTVEIDDTTNAAGYVQIGHLYASGGFQPEHNAEYPGFADGRIDPSDVETSVTGRVYGTKREQRRKVDFSLPVLSPDEADHVDELRAAMGITESVLYVPDPADAAHSQRYSFWGRFAEVNQLEYPFYNNRSTIFRLEQKK